MRQKKWGIYLPCCIALLGLMGHFHALHFPSGLNGEARFRAKNEIRELQDRDYPPLINNQGNESRIWSIRDKATQEHISPAIISALQFLLASERQTPFVEDDFIDLPLTPSDGKPAELAPVLAQDGATAPRLWVHMPPGYEDLTDAQGNPLRWRMPENLMYGYSPYAPPPPSKKAEEPTMRLPVIRGSKNAGYYRPMVENFAKRYNLNPNLVMAIIHSESDFTPTLVSNKSAMGLMQLLPSTASDEIHRFLYGKRGQVNFEQLRVPETNIRYGTAYLHILMSRYFPNIKNQLVREYCVIASYNMGPNRFLKLYGPTREAQEERLNSMSPDEFLQDAASRLPARETRYFLEKVRRMKNHYSALAM